MGQDEPLPIWELQEAEFVNALRLKVFWKDIELSESERLLEEFEIRKQRGFYFFPELDRSQVLPGFYKLSERTREFGCRTLDILHVNCALLIQAERFVSFDLRQCRLARLAGLNVMGPDL